MRFKKPVKTSVALSLDETVKKTLREMAEKDSRTLSSCINLILRDFLRGGTANITRIHPESNSKSQKIRVNVSLDWTLVEKLRVLAQEDDRPFSSYVNLVLCDYLHNLKAKEKDG